MLDNNWLSHVFSSNESNYQTVLASFQIQTATPKGSMIIMPVLPEGQEKLFAKFKKSVNILWQLSTIPELCLEIIPSAGAWRSQKFYFSSSVNFYGVNQTHEVSEVQQR